MSCLDNLTYARVDITVRVAPVSNSALILLPFMFTNISALQSAVTVTSVSRSVVRVLCRSSHSV